MNSNPLQLIQSLDHYQSAPAWRIVSVSALGGAVMAIAATACIPRLPYKMAFNVLSGTLAIGAAYSHTQWIRSNCRATAISTAMDDGFRQQVAKAFMPMDARPVREPKAIAPAAEVIDVAVEDADEDQFLLQLAEALDKSDEVAIAIASTLHKLNATVCPVGKQDGLAFTRYLFEPKPGVSIKKVVAATKDLQVGAGLADEPVVGAVAGAIAIDVTRADRQFAVYQDFIQGGDRTAGVAVPVGVDQLSGQLTWLDFTDSNSPHALVAGCTGSGKSELLRAGVTYLTENYSPKECRLLLIDPKVSSFGEFADHEMVALLERPVVGAIAIIKMIRKMEQRREQRRGYKDIASYNKAHIGAELPRILIIVEELKDLLDSLKTLTDNELDQMSSAVSEAFDSEMVIAYSGKGARSPSDILMMSLARIGQAGRSEGIHLVACTQEPSKELLGDLVSNLPVKVAMRLRSHIETEIVMPGAGAYCHKLLGKGDLLLSVPGRQLQRCQSLYLD